MSARGRRRAQVRDSSSRGALPRLDWHERTNYDVLAADGTALFTLALPPRSRLLAVRGDRVWIAETPARGSGR